MRPRSGVITGRHFRQSREEDAETASAHEASRAASTSDIVAAWGVALGILLGLVACSLL